MTSLFDTLTRAIELIATLDPAVFRYALRSLHIALVATALASVLGVPLGVLVAQGRFRGRRLVVTLLNTSLATPTVVVGLVVYGFLSRSGPLGGMGLLFSVPGIILGEFALIVPLVTALTLSAITRQDEDVRRTALSLGASRSQALRVVVAEARFGILAALVAGYGRVVGEVGIATILGGNVEAWTRTMTTAIVVNVNMGRFDEALALGIVLMAISFAINGVLQAVQGRGR